MTFSFLSTARRHFARRNIRPDRYRPRLDTLEDRAVPALTSVPAFAVAGGPRDVVVADFDRNGRADVATVGFSDGAYRVSVLPGNGAGRFYGARTFGSLSGAGEMAVADFNRDGKVDIAVTTERGVAIFRGNGNHTFMSPLFAAPGQWTSELAVGDFNRDGKADLVVTYSREIHADPFGVPTIAPDGVHVVLGNGNGTFLAPRKVSSVGAVGLAAGDVNRDGHYDLVLADRGSSVHLLLGGGSATFHTPRRVSARGSAQDVSVVDLNADGRQDLLVADVQTDAAVVLVGNGTGGFSAPRTNLVRGGVRELLVGDFNADRKVDLAAVTARGASVWLARGYGWFNPATPYAAGGTPLGGVAADFNRDGKADLGVADHGSRDVSILFGLPGGSLKAPRSHIVNAVLPASVATGDFNRDGRADVVMSNQLTAGLGFLFADYAYGYYAHRTGTDGHRTDDVVVGDFNNDGRLDVAATVLRVDPGDDAVLIVPGNGDGTFQAPRHIVYAAGAAGRSPRSLAAGDFNGDGKLDLAVGSTGGIDLLLGNGDGTLQPAAPLAGSGHDQVFASDFNADDRDDLIAYSRDGGLLLYRGGPAGLTDPPTTVPVSGRVAAITVADFNADGKRDVAVALYDIDNAAVLLGNGDGTFRPPSHALTWDGPGALTAGDFNGDGRLDLAVVNQLDQTLTVLYGDGAGRLTRRERLLAGGRPWAVVAGHFDADGRPDLAVVDLAGGSMTLLRHR